MIWTQNSESKNLRIEGRWPSATWSQSTWFHRLTATFAVLRWCENISWKQGLSFYYISRNLQRSWKKSKILRPRLYLVKNNCPFGGAREDKFSWKSHFYHKNGIPYINGQCNSPEIFFYAKTNIFEIRDLRPSQNHGFQEMWGRTVGFLSPDIWKIE